MIEITAKQLYDIYKDLPEANEHIKKYCDFGVNCYAWVNEDLIILTVTEEDGFFIWKPTTDLIIKAEKQKT